MREAVKFKVCLVGNEMVGKTSLIHRYLTGNFNQIYYPSLGATSSDIHLLFKKPDGTEVEVILMVWDILGKKEFALLQESFFKGVRGACVICDFSSLRSLKNVQYWSKRVQEISGDVPQVLVCNKSDVDNKIFGEAELQDVSEVLNLEQLITSAKEGTNVLELFETLGTKVAHTYLGADLQFIDHLSLSGIGGDIVAAEIVEEPEEEAPPLDIWSATDEELGITPEMKEAFEGQLNDSLKQLEGRDLKQLKMAIKRAYMKLKKEQDPESLDFALLALLTFYFRSLKQFERGLDERDKELESLKELLAEQHRDLLLKKGKKDEVMDSGAVNWKN